MSKRGDSRKGKKPEEPEPVVVEESEEEVDIYDCLAKVWEMEPREGRMEVGTLFGLPDGPDHTMESMVLDETYHHLSFCKEAGMNGSQTRVFLTVSTEVKERCMSGEPIATTFAWFKDQIMNNSDLRTNMAAVLAEEERIAALSRPVTVAPVEEVEDPKKKGKDKDKGKKGKVEEPEEEPPPPPPPKPRQNQLFSPSMITSICTYMASGVFGHYNLYRGVFSSAGFRPRVRVAVLPVRVDTVVPDTFSLEQTVDLDELRAQEAAEALQRAAEEAARLEAEAEKGLARMVARRLQEAREEMQRTLAAREQELTEKLEALTA